MRLMHCKHNIYIGLVITPDSLLIGFALHNADYNPYAPKRPVVFNSVLFARCFKLPSTGPLNINYIKATEFEDT